MTTTLIKCQKITQLREKADLLRTLINASPDLICFKDGQGRWLEANQAILKVFQLDNHIYHGKKDSELAELTHPCYKDSFLSFEISDDQAWQTRSTIRQEVIIPTPQGNYRIFDIIKVPVFDTAGKRQGLVIQGRDITESKQAEERLLKSEARLAEAQHIAHFGYWEWDLISGQEQWSKEMYHLLGLSSELDHLTHEVFEQYLHPDDHDEVLQALQRSISENKPYQIEFRVVWPDGTIRYVQAFGKLITTSAGKPLRILGTAQNITQIKQVEESLRDANEQLQLRVNELARRSQEINLLSKMGNLLQTCLTVEEAYSVIVRFMLRLFPTTIGLLAMHHNDSDILEPVATWGELPALMPERAKIFTVKECWALRQSRPYYMNDPQTHPVCQHQFAPSAALYICIPLIAQGELLGLLHIVQLRKLKTGDNLNNAHQQLAETIAEQIALALANIKLRQTLQNQSIRDPLTNLYNRRYLEETLEREFHRAERNQQPVGIIMVDIDHFKQFNDRFGHDAGDLVLQTLSHFLNDYIRQGDIACRYGGEEFTLILPGASLEVVAKRAELIREKIKTQKLYCNDQDLGVITLSIGVATFPAHGKRFEEVLKAADIALYQAKAQGRDQVKVASIDGE